MKNERWDAIEKLFHAARELQGVDRSRFLDQECGDDGALRRKVEALLRGDETPEGILNTAALEMVVTTLSVGTVLGPYEVLGVAGAGAMGQVYRAHDPRLNRDVAIKALPIELAYDPERLARLRREATLLASVNHPNVAAIYDVVELHDAASFLVLEFVEGSTLAERLQKGPLPLDEALGIAQQIAMALEAAHAKGIVHRDLKPANIKLTPAGTVKVLDFGLAKALTGDASETHLPQPGSLGDSENEKSAFAGTPSYMSPEQARGVAVDQRADLWAFGCVVYELLTGRKAFEGKTVSGTVVSILESEPDWTHLPAGAPPQLRQLLQHCLQRNVSERLQHASDLQHEIAASLQATVRPPARSQQNRATIVVLAVIAALVGVWTIRTSRQSGELRVHQARQLTLAPELELDPALSPDGKMVAYAFRTSARTDILVRSIAGGEPTNLTRDLPGPLHRWPRWSPDGKLIAFMSSAPMATTAWTQAYYPIQTVPYSGGTPRQIINSGFSGHAWAPDGTKLAFAHDDGIYVSSLDGTSPTRITAAFDPNSLSWSPNGKWIAYTSGNSESLFVPSLLGNLAPSSIGIVRAGGGDPRQLTDKLTMNTTPVWLPDSSSILFLSNRGGGRDVFQLKLSDSGEPLGKPVRITTGLNAFSINLSRDGKQLAYSTFLTKANLWSLPVPQSGLVSTDAALPLTTGTQTIESMSVSADGLWIAFDSNIHGNQDIYRISRTGGSLQQLTDNPGDDFAPSWSPDGNSIAFHSFRNGNRDIYIMSADGTGQQQVTSDAAQERYPDWSSDGQRLVFFSDKTGHRELYVVSREKNAWGTPQRLTPSDGSVLPRWSPDGRSIVYTDLSRGISVISPNGHDQRLLVPRVPSFFPMYSVWSGDSRTVYFRANDNQFLGSLWSIPAAGGSRRQLVQLGDQARNDFDTDGKDLFFTLTDRESDIWVLELGK